MTRTETISWLRKWNARYHVSYDGPISQFRDRNSLGLDDLEVIYRWKFRGLWPSSKVRALRSNVTESQARDWTGRALADPDDLGALCIAGLLAGVGPGGASAVLMVARPERFSVMDTRALKSLAFIGQWDTDRQGWRSSYRHWIRYLDECRRLAGLSAMTLREVDRGLYQSAGRN